MLYINIFICSMCIYIYVISLYFQFPPLQNHPDSGDRKIKQDQSSECFKQFQILVFSPQWTCGYGSIPIKIPFFTGWTSINPSYFDVNYRGTRFWHTAMFLTMFHWLKWQCSLDVLSFPEQTRKACALPFAVWLRRHNGLQDDGSSLNCHSICLALSEHYIYICMYVCM
jgi:hypothetical protein